MVTVNSGACEPTDKFENTPRDKWHLLLITKRSFLDRRLKHDCRCLIQFCEEAESVFAELGYKSAEDMIREGYELDPTQIELAVAWLKHNEPETGIGIQEVSKRVWIQQLAKDNPKWTQQRIADEVGVSQPYVNMVISETSESEKVLIPPHINGNADRADFRKLPEELREQVAAKEISLNAAAIRAGIRKKPTPLQELLRAWKKATKEERTEFMKRKDQQ
jgi:predicted transcriptional regulator